MIISVAISFYYSITHKLQIIIYYMAFYENTMLAKQDLAEKDLREIISRYNEIINQTGKVLKVEEWGLLNLANKIQKYKKAFYIHFKFEGNNETLTEIERKAKLDSSIIRFLTVKYKKLDLKNEFFDKKIKNNEKK